jgi:hypothetical protein
VQAMKSAANTKSKRLTPLKKFLPKQKVGNMIKRSYAAAAQDIASIATTRWGIITSSPVRSVINLAVALRIKSELNIWKARRRKDDDRRTASSK